MSPDPPILIAGGGIAGLASALALAKHGIASTIVEREPVFSEAGAGIQISPNAMHVLMRLGVADVVKNTCGFPDAISLCDGLSGRELTRLPLGQWIAERHGASYCVTLRSLLQDALLKVATKDKRIQIKTNFDVRTIRANRNGVAIETAGGQGIEGACLIAADGLWSRARQFVHQEVPTFAGKTAARTLVNRASLPLGFQENITRAFLAPNAHVVAYPVQSGAFLAVVAITSEAWSGAGWSAPVDRNRLVKTFAQFAPDVRALFESACEWRKWPLFEMQQPVPWRRNTVAMIGDAAHPILPFLAQGAAMALEDSVVLADCILKDGDNVKVAFQNFEIARKARIKKITSMSRRNGTIYHLGGFAAAARNAVLRNRNPKTMMAELDWLYGWRPPN